MSTDRLPGTGPVLPTPRPQRRIETRTILALILLLMILAGGYVLISQQQAAQRQQLDTIGLSVSCSIAGGQVVNRGGTNICVDANGRVVDLPAK